MEKNNFNKIKIAEICLFLAVFLCYGVYAVGLFFRVGIDSDYSNLVLEAADILNGNVFLADWNLTGITFFTTDLLYFIVGVFFAGISVNAYYIAVVGMFLALILSALLLIKTTGKKANVTDLLIFFAIAGFPPIYGCNILRAHTAAIIWIFLAIFFLTKAYYSHEIDKKCERIYLLLFTFFMILACCGDSESLIIGILPLIIICVYNLLGNNIVHKKFNIRLLILTIVSAIIGKTIEIIFVSIGNTEKNSFLGSKIFGDFKTIGEKFEIYVKSITGMSKADFFGKNIISIDTLWHFLRICLILFTFYIIFKNINLFFRRKRSDLISVILSLGFVIMSAILIFTDIAANTMSARYIAYFPVLSALLIIRYFKFNDIFEKRACNKKIAIKTVGVAFFSLILLSAIQPISLKPVETSQERLGAFLEKNGLQNGYAKFWNASHITVSTENKVKVRAVIFDKQANLGQFQWFCKNEWYYPDYANFVIIENKDANDQEFMINEINVEKSLGKPKKRLKFEEYTIFVYSYDISKKIISVGGT
ncbi:MAG: hypothetical protein RR540_00580 [Oscillospiraceae bacterium]